MPKVQNRLLVSVTPKMEKAEVWVSMYALHPALRGARYRTKALIDSGSTNSVFGKKAWRAFGLDKQPGLKSTLKQGQTMVASGKMMDLFFLPVMMHVKGRAAFKTSIALQKDSDLDVIGFKEMAKGDIQLR